MEKILVFFIGSCFASCINVIVYRSKRNMNWISGRSICPNCGHRLSYFDMLPIIGYLSLKGKCRYCGNKINIRYLIVEVIGGLILLESNINDVLIMYSLLFIGLSDYEDMLIDNIYFLLLSILVMVGIYPYYMNINNIVGLIVGFLSMFTPYLLKYMGDGDVILHSMMGYYLGYIKLIKGFSISMIIASVYSLYLIFVKKISKKAKIPLIPFLLIGYYFVMMKN